MKKRIISMLLTVLMVLSLFSGMGVSAYAVTYNGANTIEYTMAQGDFVLRICQRLGLNYYTCKDAIMILNNIRDGQWNTLTVGRTLTLPASDNDARLIANGAGTTVYNSGAAATTATTSTVTGTATTTGTATGTATTANPTAASADKLAYYLVPYTMSSGETVSGVCNALGVNFSIFSPFIKQVNNISNWTKVRAGDTLIIPTPVAPAVGTTCYGVMEHTVASKDTAYGITASKGVNYSANERLLKVLNQTDNLASLTAGGKFFYPVPLTVSVPGTGNPGSTTTTTTTTTVTDGNGTTTTSTTTTAKLYKLASGMAASDGTMLFYVNNQPVTAAPAGAKVTIVTDAAAGKAIQGLTVKHADGTADLQLSGDAFIMPSCDARVDAVIKNGHNINIAANYSGKATASVGGISVQSAVKGATVIIKSVDPNYEIAGIYATYRKLISSSNKTQLTVSASNAFVMPDGDVDVEVTLRPVSTYAFYVNDPDNGSFYLQVNGSAVTRAAKGAQVTVVAKADAGFEPTTLVVKNHSTGAAVNVYSNTFTMPAFDVDVEVTFAGKGNNILVMPSQIGNVYAFDKTTGITDASQFVTEAETGKDVYLVAINEDGAAPVGITSGAYDIAYDIVRNSDGLKVKAEKVADNWTMNVDGTATTSTYFKFKMPKGGVTVTPIITAKAAKNITATFIVNGTPVAAGKYSDCGFSITWNGKTSNFTKSGEQISAIKAIKSQIPVGEYLDIRYDDSVDSVSFVRYRITDGTNLMEEETNEANLHGYFKMPNKDITIEAYFETGKAAIGPAAITGVGTVSYRDDLGKSINSSDADKIVTIIASWGNGFKFDDAKYQSKLFVTRKDNGAPVPLTKPANNEIKDAAGKVIGYMYTFKMPSSGVDVQAIFDPSAFVITMKCVDETGKSLTGLGLWQVAINLEPGVVDNDPSLTQTTFNVAYEDYVTVAMTEKGWSNYDMVSFRIDSREYVADVHNYFYNFQMIDERAKNLEIVAVLQPRVPYTPTVQSLSAIYDMTKGAVEFLILDSATGYSREYLTTVGAGNVILNSQFVKNAFAGDKVAIAAVSSDGKYKTTVNDINITTMLTDANRIIPKLEYYVVDGKNVPLFTFIMPESPVVATVNFSGEKYRMTVVVTDKNGNPVGGMVNLTAGAQTFGDAAANDSFGQIEYNSMVTILRSAKAVTENKTITKVDVKTSASVEPVYYYDYSLGGNGPAFYMPASDVTVYITVDDFNAANVNIVNFQFQLDGGTLVARSGPAMTDPVVTEYNVGDEIYVFEVPDAGREHLGQGDLSITNNGTVYTVANWHATTADGTNVWKVKVPAGITIFSATWGVPANVPNAENIIYAPVSNIVGGTLEFKQGGANVSTYATGTGAGDLVITATPAAGYDALTKDNIVIKDVNDNVLIEGKDYTLTGSTITIKADSLPEGGISVSAAFPAKKSHITFKLNTSMDPGAVLTLNGLQQNIVDAAGKSWDLDPGTIIVISSGNPGYNAVAAVSGAYGSSLSATINYVVPAQNDTVEITLASTNPAVTLNPVSGGAVNFRKADDHTAATDVAANFTVGEDIYIETLPAYGYKLKKLEIKQNANGAVLTPTDSAVEHYDQISNLPIGGITVTAEFEPVGVSLKFTPAVTGTASGVVADVSTGNGINASGDTIVSATFGQTITVTPAAGYEWAAGAMAAVVEGNQVSISGSGNTGARSFEITNKNDYSIALNLVHVG